MHITAFVSRMVLLLAIAPILFADPTDSITDVSLIKPVDVPIMSDGTQIGSMQWPIGKKLHLLKVEGNMLRVESGGKALTIPSDKTDYAQQKDVILKAKEKQQTIEHQRQQQQQAANQSEQERLAKIQSNLDFKGLYLGMTTNDVARLCKDSFWKLPETESDRVVARMFTKDSQIFLKADENAPDEFKRIAIQESPVNPKTYYWNYVICDVYQNRIYYMTASSGYCDASLIDAKIKTWVKMTRWALEKKYGPPTKVFVETEDIDIFSWKTAYYTSVCLWELNNGKIKISLHPIDFNGPQYGAAIEFEDSETSKLIRSQSINKSDL